jgi:hypothetical protein
MKLSRGDHRINHGPDIVDRHVVDELDSAGIRIDLDLGDVCPARIGEVDRIVIGVFLEPRLEHFKRIVVRNRGSERNIAKTLLAILGLFHQPAGDVVQPRISAKIVGSAGQRRYERYHSPLCCCAGYQRIWLGCGHAKRPSEVEAYAAVSAGEP